MSLETILKVTVGVAAAGLVAYAIYFDNKRRSDPEYKAKLRESKFLNLGFGTSGFHHSLAPSIMIIQ